MTKKAKQGGDAPLLPKDIVSIILIRLPAKSLIRFQSVCQDWRNLLRTPSFIAEHFHHSSLKNPCLFWKKNDIDDLLLRLIDGDMNVLEVHRPPLIGHSSNYKIAGCSNGFLCVEIDHHRSLTSRHKSLALWNPATSEVRQIPRTKKSEKLEWDCTGFGFSHIVDDYKIVLTYMDSKALVIGAEVYSLSTGSWKEIECQCLKDITIGSDGFMANGSMFWACLTRGELFHHVIVSLDFAKEVFSSIQFPDLSQYYRYEFAMCEEKLSIISLCRIVGFSYSQIELLVLEEGVGSERWSWTKKYTYNPCPWNLELNFSGTIWRNEIILSVIRKSRLASESEHVMRKDGGKTCLYLINMITNEAKMCDIPFRIMDKVVNYVENLAPISSIHFEEP